MEVEFDHPTRGLHFRQACDEVPAARNNEINHMIQKVEARPGNVVVDFGCGNGAITDSIATLVGPSGKVHALDVSRASMKRLLNLPDNSNIKGALLTEERLPLDDGSIDIVAGLANFHHVPDKGAMFKEFGRVLRPGGRLVIGDIAHGTDVQRYFDGPVDRYCSTGHKHKFLDRRWAGELCSAAGLIHLTWEIADVPWVFESEAQAKRYIHLIHDIQCDPDEYLLEAKTFLGCSQNGSFKLNWQLFYLVAVKPVSHTAPLH